MRKNIPELKWRGGIAYVYWYDEAKRRTERVSLRTKDCGEAQARYAAFLVEGADTIAGAGRNARISVSQALDDYWREHVVPKCADKARQEDAITHLKAFFGLDTALGDVDIPTSRSYAAARRAGAIGGGSRTPNKVGSDSTIRRELTVLVAAGNHAVKWKRTPPTDVPQVEKPTETPSVADWYSKEEIAGLLNVSDGDLRAFIKIAYYTAARRASIETLTAEQVDLEQKRINLSKPGEQRTTKRRPIVPLFDEIRGEVVGLIQRAGCGPLFGAGRDFYRPFRELCEEIGLAGKSNPHLLRHSRATHLLQAGAGLWPVAKLLGDTVATVERVYGHHCPDFLGATLGNQDDIKSIAL